MTINRKNLAIWIEEMRTTDAPQVGRALARLVHDKVGFCCLGLGSCRAGVANNIQTELDWLAKDPERRHVNFGFGAENVGTLAPREFLEWLGIAPPKDDRWQPRAFDVLIDWADCGALPTKNGTLATYSCSRLNDEGFTFSQIADIVEFFGIRDQS